MPISFYGKPGRLLTNTQADRAALHAGAFVGDNDPELRWRVFGPGDTLTYLGGEPPTLKAAVLQKRDGKWEDQTSGRCTTFVHHAGRTTAVWALSEASPSTATEFSVTAIDRQCASGVTAEKRVGPARILETATSVTVTFTAARIVGGANCPGHAPATRVVRLAAPLGGRILLDGAVFPPQSPCGIGATVDELGPNAYCSAIR